MKTIFQSVTVRLMIPVFLVVFVALAAHALLESRARANRWSEVMRSSAERMSGLISDATHYSMLLNRKEDVQQILEKISKSPAVASVRVYDKAGKIAFSGHPGEIGWKIDIRESTCTLCHYDPETPKKVRNKTPTRVTETAGGARVVGVMQPIVNHRECSRAECHAHDASRPVLGVLDVQMSLAEVQAQEELDLEETYQATGILLAIVGLGVALFVRHFVRRPLQALRRGTERVAKGDLESRIEPVADDEFGELAHAFNDMTFELKKTRHELTEWSKELEHRVSEKTEELSALHRQQVQVEKMAVLGKLSAVVAHELNNPLGGMLTYAKLITRKLKKVDLEEPVSEELGRYLSLIESEARRCGDIVRNLLLFARAKSEKLEQVHANEIVQRTAMLIEHKCSMSQVQLETALADGDDLVTGASGDIQQALLALTMNAIEATTANEGKVSIAVLADPEQIEFRIQDNGCGIAPDVLPHIFEPFFTTKETTGMGLGLSIAAGIAERHGGSITVDSAPDRGTTFHFRIARHPTTLDASAN